MLWQDGRTTDSSVKWYGVGTRSEFRLTGFGKDFPFRTFDNVGDLLVFIPVSYTEFIAYVLFDDEDIQEIQEALGVQIVRTWAAYEAGAGQIETETEDDCIDRRFRQFVEPLTGKFPPVAAFSEKTYETLRECLQRFAALAADDRLVKSLEAEYQLFRMAERQICQAEIMRMKRDVDDFLQVASSIMNRRKSRAGRSLENHVEYLLREARIPHEMRPQTVDGEPDVVIPSTAAYHDSEYPLDKLFIVGVKTTCKDRWRQVLNEGRRVPDKHILTTQAGISENQLNDMHKAGVTLIVPKKFHKLFPKNTPITLLNVTEFITTVRTRLDL